MLRRRHAAPRRAARDTTSAAALGTVCPAAIPRCRSMRTSAVVAGSSVRSATARISITREVLLNEARAQVHVELNEGLVADARERVDLAGLDDEDVPRSGLELLAVDGVSAATGLHELHFIIWM